MDYSCKPAPIKPRIIIHGGAGNITRENMPRKSYEAYQKALLGILRKANEELNKSGASALDTATYAVSLLELNPLFNAGHGAVYTSIGTHELEASVMVSRGYRKRGVGVMKVRRTKHPIQLAREMLIRGEQENGGGAQGHCQLEGETCDILARQWGLEQAKPSWFWTRRRWDEHRRGLGLRHDDETYEKLKKHADENVHDYNDNCQTTKEHPEYEQEFYAGDIHWDDKEYLPQGTVGAVVLDSTGTLCVATSTGGLINKLPGRIGDTPTLGAGFWAEQWDEVPPASPGAEQSFLASCIPLPIARGYYGLVHSVDLPSTQIRAAAMSGTGNGDSFLRVNAVRTAAAIARYSSAASSSRAQNLSRVSLQQAVTNVAGPHGQLQRSADDRWHKTGEGEGGIIGIELVDGRGKIVFDFNCGGMFHAWVDDCGQARFELFQDGPRPPP